jgi:hypothetical protein
MSELILTFNVTEVKDIFLGIYDIVGNDITINGDGTSEKIKNTYVFHFNNYGIQNVTISVSGSTIIRMLKIGVNSVSKNALIQCVSFGNVGLQTISFADCINLISVPTILPSTVTRLSNCFFNTTNFKQNIGVWSISNVIVLDNFIKNTSITPDIYDEILIGFASQEPNIHMNNIFDCDVSYTPSISGYARNILMNTYQWLITDGGPIQPPVPPVPPVPPPVSVNPRISMGSLFTDNSMVYYKSHSLAPGGIGGVRNYRHKSKKT